MKQELTEDVPLGTSGVADAVLEPRPRIGFVSLGCPKNLVDSEVMMGLLDQAGAEMTDFLIVLNTQSVSELCPSAIPRICREADTIEFICRQLYGSSLSRSRDSG